MVIKMKIARILYPVHVLGPKERVVIWTYGCEHGCKGCANPELWRSEGLPEMEPERLQMLLEKLLEKGPIEGITISGGDPFLYPESLLGILKIARRYTEDILVYTGYQKDELQSELCKEALEQIAVLIDGPYQEEANKGHVLKGSENQQIYYLKKEYQAVYEAYIKEHQGRYLVENFPAKGGFISVGIHKPDFREQIENIGNIKDTEDTGE